VSVSTYTVAGMACQSCAGFVTEEIQRIPGVAAVVVDIHNGLVTVTSDQDLDTTCVRRAVGDAGYELVRGDQEDPFPS
jgi:copper chaperone CopZ